MMREKLVAYVVFAFWLFASTVVNVLATKTVQWTIESTFDRHAPFALLFASLVVLPFALFSTAACASSMLRRK